MLTRTFGTVVQSKSDARVNAPNVVTMLGYGATVYWLLGGSKAFALAGLLADEVDGRLARSTNEATEFGSTLDWAADLTLTGAIAAKTGLLWTMPATVLLQAYLRQQDIRPTVGSARALYTLYGMAVLK